MKPTLQKNRKLILTTNEDCEVWPVYDRAYQDGPSAANDPTEMTHERHGDSLQDDLSGGEEDKVVIGEVGIVAIGPHVGSQVGVNVRVTKHKPDLFYYILLLFPWL